MARKGAIRILNYSDLNLCRSHKHHTRATSHHSCFSALGKVFQSVVSTRRVSGNQKAFRQINSTYCEWLLWTPKSSCSFQSTETAPETSETEHEHHKLTVNILYSLLKSIPVRTGNTVTHFMERLGLEPLNPFNIIAPDSSQVIPLTRPCKRNAFSRKLAFGRTC